MKTVSGGFNTGLQRTVTTLAQLLRITRRDGVIYRRSTATRRKTFDGQVYLPGGFDPTDISSTFQDGIADLEIIAYFDGELTEDDVRFGKLDDAKAEIMWGDWETPGNGTMKMFNGIVANTEITDDRTAVKFSLAGQISTLTGPMGEVRSATCRAIFGDERCKVDIEALKLTTAAIELDGAELTVQMAGAIVPLQHTDAHKDWRLLLSRYDLGELRGAGYTFAAEIELRSTVGGANAAVGGTASASVNTATAGNAFDGDAATGWFFNGSTAWIAYHKATPFAVLEYTFKTREALAGPRSIFLQYSDDDGVTWNNVIGMGFTDLTFTASETKTFSIVNEDNDILPEDAFAFGTVLFGAGANNGDSITIASVTRELDELIINLMLPPTFPVAEDDVVYVYPGCMKTVAMCKFYRNIENMRAEPYTPTALFQGQNRVTQ